MYVIFLFYLYKYSFENLYEYTIRSQTLGIYVTFSINSLAIVEEMFEGPVPTSEDKFASTNRAELAKEMMEQCCATTKPKIFVPAPQSQYQFNIHHLHSPFRLPSPSQSQEIYLIFPEDIPRTVAIQCKNATKLLTPSDLDADMETFQAIMRAISPTRSQVKAMETLVYMRGELESI